MALTGQTQNKRPGAGVYPGAGVAQGGQQGRMNTMHGGIGAKSGGATAKASQPRNADPRGPAFDVAPISPGKPHIKHGQDSGRLPMPKPFVKPQGGMRYVTRGGKRVAVAWNQLTPAEKLRFQQAAPGAAAPVAGAPAAPAYTPSFALEDSDYFMGLAGAQADFDGALNPINSELAKLRYAGVGGKTLYDTMYENANRDFGYSVRDTRDQMHKQGLGRSGRMDRAASGLASGWTDTQRQLDETVGGTAINRLETQAAQARSSFASQQAALQMAAADRARQRREAYNASLYGQTIMPEEG